MEIMYDKVTAYWLFLVVICHGIEL